MCAANNIALLTLFYCWSSWKRLEHFMENKSVPSSEILSSEIMTLFLSEILISAASCGIMGAGPLKPLRRYCRGGGFELVARLERRALSRTLVSWIGVEIPVCRLCYI